MYTVFCLIVKIYTVIIKEKPKEETMNCVIKRIVKLKEALEWKKAME